MGERTWGTALFFDLWMAGMAVCCRKDPLRIKHTRPQPKSWGNCADKPRALLPWSHCHFPRLTGDQGSGILLSMMRAQGLAIILEDMDHLPAGAQMRVLMLDWPERG